MCVIIAKNKGDRTPTIEELKNCFTRNDDGAGFMYVNNNRVVIDKGYMTKDAFIKHYKKLLKKFDNFDNKCLVVHCRIGTAGTNTAGNTHPYPITSSIDKLHKTHTTCNIAIAHNGIISSYNPPSTSQDDTNDTQEFVSTYLTSLRSGFPRFYRDKHILDAIEYLTNSKFAILTRDDELVTIGDFVEHDGLLFSNTSYMEYTPVVYKYDTYKYDAYDDGYNYTAYNWDDWYKKYDEKVKDKKTLDYTRFVDIPSTYTIEYDNEARRVGDNYYCIDIVDNLLYKYNDATDEFDYITNDYIVYDANYQPIDAWEI